MCTSCLTLITFCFTKLQPFIDVGVDVEVEVQVKVAAIRFLKEAVFAGILQEMLKQVGRGRLGAVLR